jgi:hypothetical protein
MKTRIAMSSFVSIIAWLLITSITSTLRAEDEAGFKPIFDGKTLTGWDGNPGLWSVQDGAITGQTTKENPTRGNTFIIWRHGELDDFDLRLEYRIFGGNSGVQYRSFENPKWGKWVVGGYQADFEAGDTWSGANYGERFRGVLAKRGQSTVIGDNHKPKVVAQIGDTKELQANIKKEDWNSYRIVAKGYTLTHEINGKMTAKVVDEDKKRRLRSGILALQLHAGPPMKVQFRNIRLKRLPLGDKKKIVMISGHRSHGYGSHEFNAGNLLMKKLLDENAPNVHSTVYQNLRHAKPTHPVMDSRGWPNDPTAFDNADAVVLFMNGGGGHPVNRRLEELDTVMRRGVGLACLHYGVEVPKGKPGDRFLDWIGGYFEAHWSVNPHWTIQNPRFAKDHPITRGVESFSANDEWYFHMRFPEGLKGVTPILSAIPPKDTTRRKDGPHSGNPTVRARVAKGELEHLAWALQRPDGSRGFGFTGLHAHKNLQIDGFRSLLLNAMVWVAGAEVPQSGVPSKKPSDEEIAANQDYPRR